MFESRFIFETKKIMTKEVVSITLAQIPSNESIRFDAFVIPTSQNKVYKKSKGIYPLTKNILVSKINSVKINICEINLVEALKWNKSSKNPKINIRKVLPIIAIIYVIFSKDDAEMPMPFDESKDARSGENEEIANNNNTKKTIIKPNEPWTGNVLVFHRSEVGFTVNSNLLLSVFTRKTNTDEAIAPAKKSMMNVIIKS